MPLGGHVDQAAIVALIIAVCGVIYQAGRLSMRVDYIEKELSGIPAAIRDGFKEIAALIRGEQR